MAWLVKFTYYRYLPGHALRQYLLQDLALFSPVIFDNISTVWRLEIGNILVAHYEAGRQEVNIIPIRGKQRRFLPWILSVMVSKEVFRVAKRQKVIKLSQEQDKGEIRECKKGVNHRGR
jgi:hypothetical protein